MPWRSKTRERRAYSASSFSERGAVGELGDPDPARGPHDVPHQAGELLGLRLEQHDVGLGVLAPIPREAVLEPRVEREAEDLVEDREQAAARERALVAAVGEESAGQVVPGRDDRVDAEDEAAALLQGEGDVGRLPHAAVDVVDAVDPHGPEEARQGAGGGDGPRDGDGVVAGLPEDAGLSGVERDGDDAELSPEGAEVVRAALLGEPGGEPRLEAVEEEEARGEEAGEGGDEVRDGGVLAVLVEVVERAGEGDGGRKEARADLPEVRAEKGELVEVGGAGMGRVLEEDGRRDPAGDEGSDVGTGRDADEDVALRQGEPVEPLLEGREDSDLVDRPGDAASGADEAPSEREGAGGRAPAGGNELQAWCRHSSSGKETAPGGRPGASLSGVQGSPRAQAVLRVRRRGAAGWSCVHLPAEAVDLRDEGLQVLLRRDVQAVQRALQSGLDDGGDAAGDLVGDPARFAGDVGADRVDVRLRVADDALDEVLRVLRDRLARLPDVRGGGADRLLDLRGDGAGLVTDDADLVGCGLQGAVDLRRDVEGEGLAGGGGAAGGFPDHVFFSFIRAGEGLPLAFEWFVGGASFGNDALASASR